MGYVSNDIFFVLTIVFLVAYIALWGIKQAYLDKTYILEEEQRRLNGEYKNEFYHLVKMLTSLAQDHDMYVDVVTIKNPHFNNVKDEKDNNTAQKQKKYWTDDFLDKLCNEEKNDRGKKWS